MIGTGAMVACSFILLASVRKLDGLAEDIGFCGLFELSGTVEVGVVLSDDLVVAMVPSRGVVDKTKTGVDGAN